MITLESPALFPPRDAHTDAPRVLVVDDDEHVRKLEAEILKLTGHAMTVNLRLLASQRPIVTPARETAPAPERSPRAAPRKPAADDGTAKPAAAARVVQDTAAQRNLLGEIDPSRDPFVRQVIETFGATVVKVTVAPSVLTADTEVAS